MIQALLLSFQSLSDRRIARHHQETAAPLAGFRWHADPVFKLAGARACYSNGCARCPFRKQSHMKQAINACAIPLILVGCISAPPARAQTRQPAPVQRTAPAIPVRAAMAQMGLEAVMGKDVGTLKRLFGEPRLDVVEVHGRKLQFVGKACVLDVFFYPEGKGRTEIVTYVDARRSDGAAVDRASCIDALQRR